MIEGFFLIFLAGFSLIHPCSLQKLKKAITLWC